MGWTLLIYLVSRRVFDNYTKAFIYSVGFENKHNSPWHIHWRDIWNPRVIHRRQGVASPNRIALHTKRLGKSMPR